MNQQPHYYTPAIEDVSAGFQYMNVPVTANDNRGMQTWPGSMLAQDVDNVYNHMAYLIEHNAIRVPYLSPEALTAEGWNIKTEDEHQLTAYFNDINRAQYRMIYFPFTGEEDAAYCRMTIFKVASRENGGNQTLYKGRCRSTNDLRRVMRELDIKA